MGKRDLGSRIKASLGEWANYCDEPTNMSPPSDDSSSAPGRSKQEEDVAVVDYADKQGIGVTSRSDAVVPKAQVAELEAALERERENSRRLMDVVAREQVLHAVTLQSKQQQKSSHPGDPSSVRPHSPPSPPSPVKPRRFNSIDAPVSPRTSLWWILLALFIAVGCAALAFSLAR